MGRRVSIVVALTAMTTASLAAPKPDPLKPPADQKPKAPSSAKRAAAKAHYAKAQKLYAKKKLEAARKELELALDAAPDPDLDYAIAQIDIELDQCEFALAELQKYLDTPHGPKATKAAQDELDTCKAKLAPPPPPPPPPTQPVKVAPPPEPHRWYSDKLTDGLVGAGVVSGIVSLLCYRAAAGDLDTADASMTLAEHAQHVADAHSMRTTSLVFAGASVALVTAGVWRYMRHDRHSESRTIAVTPTSGGGIITISGSLP